MRKRLKGSMTVEATIVISFCLIITTVAIITAYEIFGESMEIVQQQEEEIESVHLFLKKEMVVEIVEGIGN